MTIRLWLQWLGALSLSAQAVPALAGARPKGDSIQQNRVHNFDYWFRQAERFSTLGSGRRPQIVELVMHQLMMGWDYGLLDRRAEALEILYQTARKNQKTQYRDKKSKVVFMESPSQFGFRTGTDLYFYQVEPFRNSGGKSFLRITSIQKEGADSLTYRSTFLRKEVIPGIDEPKLDGFEYVLPVSARTSLSRILPQRVGDPQGWLIDGLTGQRQSHAPTTYHFDFLSGDPQSQAVLTAIQSGLGELTFSSSFRILNEP